MKIAGGKGANERQAALYANPRRLGWIALPPIEPGEELKLERPFIADFVEPAAYAGNIYHAVAHMPRSRMLRVGTSQSLQWNVVMRAGSARRSSASNSESHQEW